MKAPKVLSRLYQSNRRVHLALAPLRHGWVALRNLALPSELHQAWGTTAANRRPKVMQALARIVPDRVGARVLSFGCSTGEEVLDLREHYRQARVFGTDLNRASLRKAEERLKDSGVGLFQSTYDNLQRYGPFDLILACSVFLRHPEDTHADDLSKLYPFEAFEKGVCRLFDNTLPGGFLLIHNTNYRVGDTRLGALLTPVRHPDIVQNPRVPLFNPNGRKLGVTGYDEQLFRRES
jgi:hypothetical protein